MSTLSALEILSTYKDVVWPELEKSLKEPHYPQSFQVPPKYRDLAKYHWSLVSDYPLRKSKYLRPTFVMLAALAMGEKKENAVKVAAAMQISEEWILIHDDLEDESQERRGLPTLHRLHSNALAINAGDALQAISWKKLFDATAEFSENKRLKLINEFYNMISRTILGQTTDIRWIQENKIDITDNDWYFVANGKTSYYTIAGPLRLGAIVAGATEKQLESIARFGSNLGMCFQIVDDILDITSDFEGMKKQTGNDIYEGKRTLVLGHLLQKTQGNEHKKLIKIISKTRDEKTKDEVDWIIKMLFEKGSIKYAQEKALIFRKEGEKIFEKELGFFSVEPYREQLKTLTKFILDRKH